MSRQEVELIREGHHCGTTGSELILANHVHELDPGERRQRLVDLDSGAPASRGVKAALLEGLRSGMVTIDAITHKLALSRRRLQRRIREGSSYQKTLQDTRESLARNCPEKTEFPSAEISFLLGFDEPNSFYRAFWTRTGMTRDGVRRPTKMHDPYARAFEIPSKYALLLARATEPTRL